MPTADDAPTDVPRRSDGERTHAAILEAAMRLASIEGVSSLTIGRLAREVGVSKSGVFAHFRSRESLQRETIDAAGEIFRREVLEPGLAAPDGLARLAGLCEAYLSYVERGVFPGGCFFAHLLAEYDAPAGAVHDQLVEIQQGWIGLLEQQVRNAQRHGELDVETDPAQLAFDLYGPMELTNFLSVLYREPGVVERGRAAVKAALDRARRRAPRGAS